LVHIFSILFTSQETFLKKAVRCSWNARRKQTSFIY